MFGFRLLLLLVGVTICLTPDEECQMSFAHLQENIQNPQALNPYDLGVLLFTGKGIADMGSRGMCQVLQMNYVYMMLPPQAMGMCFYPYCSTNFLNQNKADILSLVSLLIPIPESVYPLISFKTETQISNPIRSNIQDGYIAATIVVVILGALCLFGVVVQCTHLFDKKPGLDEPKTDNQVIENKSKLGLFFLSFSAWFNFKNLLKTGGKGASYDPNLEVFAGVRTLAMMYVILGHCCEAFSAGVKSSFDSLMGSWFGVFAKAGEFAVDAFFLMAAFLATYVMMGKLSSKGCINPLMVYFHRWWRLIFPMALLIIIASYIFLYLMSGPLIQYYDKALTKNCEKYWWTNLIFINNLYPWDLNDECVSHTWYLANDFQFFLLLPFLIMLINKSTFLGYSLLGLLFALSIGITSYLTVHYQLYIPNAVGSGDVYYTKPYCRIPPYLLGVFLGHLYYSRKQFKLGKQAGSFGNSVFRLYESSGVCSWISAIIGVGLTTFLTLIYHTAIDGQGWSLAVSALWNSLSRVVYVLGMMMVLLPTFEGRLTWVKLFMSCEYFQVMGKLTYSAYLIHIPVGVSYMYSIKYTPYGSMDNIIYHYLGLYALAYLCALILFLLSEYPPLNIERFLLFPKKKRRQESLLPDKYIGSHIVKAISE